MREERTAKVWFDETREMGNGKFEASAMGYGSLICFDDRL
jgi:hypothetical protein